MRLHLIVLVFLLTIPLSAQNGLPLGPNSMAYPKIAQGQVTEHTWRSNIYPNTVRNYYVYVPAQYDGSMPAALMVFQDGHTYLKKDGDFRVPTVFDNLIAQEKMPITIGLFVNPGHDVDADEPESPWRVTNRSLEYDTISNRYVRFLYEELIPELRKEYQISDDPQKHAICGISSGGICAFTAAWHRPDIFHKVLSHIGSFTDIRGGHNYPPLIRQSAKKAIKILLQDGSQDLDNEYGNWWLANQQMAAALAYKDYEYKFVPDTGAHNGQHAGLVFPESLIWLWSDQVPDRVASQRYRSPHTASSESLMIMGETTHLSEIQYHTIDLLEKMSFIDEEFEQLFIVKKGSVSAQLLGSDKTLTRNSVVFLAQGDQLNVRSMEMGSQLYRMSFEGRHPNLNASSPSFSISYAEVPFVPHEKGGVRKYFETSTKMCDRFEMHITTLKPGLKSHQPHTHKSEELIIMIDGDTEEEIGNARYQGQVGDVYYLGANVPHAIKNVGVQPCTYFAFQWH